jgi:hypothetical protein
MSPTRIRNANGQLLEQGWLLQVVELAKIGGWYVNHAPDNRPGRKTGRPQRVIGDTTGFPDLVLLRRGELIVAELKTDRGRLGTGQQEWLDRFARVGQAVKRLVDGATPVDEAADYPRIEAYVWRPKDLPAVQARLVGRMPAVGAVTDDMEDAA